MRRHERYDETLANFQNTTPEFDGYEQFKKALEEKKGTDTKTSEDDQKSTKPSIITELFVKYYYILFGGIIVISLTLIIVINKKNSFDFNT